MEVGAGNCVNPLIVRAGSENHIIISIVYEFVVLFWVERHACILRLISFVFSSNCSAGSGGEIKCLAR